MEKRDWFKVADVIQKVYSVYKKVVYTMSK